MNLSAGKAAVNQWKSETISAFCRSEDFQSQQNEELEKLWGHLTHDLKVWLTSDTVEKHKSRLRGDIFKPAIKLHQDMRSSFRQYKVAEDGDFTPFETRLLSEDIGEEQDMKDIATWGTETACTDDTFLHYLYPGIIRLGLDNEEDYMWLVRPVYVFSKHRPTGRAAGSLKDQEHRVCMRSLHQDPAMYKKSGEQQRRLV